MMAQRKLDIPDELISGFVAKKVVGWIVAVGLTLAFFMGIMVNDTHSRLTNLEHTSLTKEQAAELKSSVEMLRQDIGFLRVQLHIQEINKP